MSAHDLTGTRLKDRYRLTAVLGTGGMGQVYSGVDEVLDRKVAVKVLLREFADRPRYHERFLREAKSASKIQHPNVVQIIYFGQTPDCSLFYAMEHLRGRDLAHLLYRHGPLPWPRARHMLLQMVRALAATHERNIVHRDIKPANFFVVQARGLQDFIKLIDFGIAKLAADPARHEQSSDNSLTGVGEVMGTAKYMAPEQAYGSSDDPRVDIYAAGIVAYEMLAGQVPFKGETTFEILQKHVADPPTPLRSFDPNIPAAVEDLVMCALAKQVEDRFASMDEMAAAISAISADAPVTSQHSTPPSRPEPVANATAVAEVAPPAGRTVVAAEAAPQPDHTPSESVTRISKRSTQSSSRPAEGPSAPPPFGGQAPSPSDTEPSIVHGDPDPDHHVDATMSGSMELTPQAQPPRRGRRRVALHVAFAAGALAMGYGGMEWLNGGKKKSASPAATPASSTAPSPPTPTAAAGANEAGPEAAPETKTAPLPSVDSSTPRPADSPAPRGSRRGSKRAGHNRGASAASPPSTDDAPPSETETALAPVSAEDEKLGTRLESRLEKKCWIHATSYTKAPLELQVTIKASGKVVADPWSDLDSSLRTCLRGGLGLVNFPAGARRLLTLTLKF
ncbi:MAG: protein kinase [Deltaproteobacteria bacterium]|nr:protein kinase [Deltaproteobacteria bacterium]